MGNEYRARKMSQIIKGWINYFKWVVHEMANCRKGIWRAAKMLNRVLMNKEIVSQGFISMTDYYLQVGGN